MHFLLIPQVTKVGNPNPDHVEAPKVVRNGIIIICGKVPVIATNDFFKLQPVL